MGGMAFPSASEPNPVAQGIRGKGPETINYNPTPTTPNVPPTTPTAPPPNTATTWGGPMFFQDPYSAGYVDILSGGQAYSAPWSNIQQQAQAAGYGSSTSGLPIFNTSWITGPGNPGANQGPFNGMQFATNSFGTYDPSNPAIQQNLPKYQPYSPYSPNISQALGQPFSANNTNQFGYINYQKSGFQPGTY